MSKDLVKAIAGLGDGRVNYEPHDISKVIVTYGLPPAVLSGVDFVRARHLQPQWRLVMGLTGNGKHVSNNNTSGVIEIGLLDGVASCAAIQILQLSGIPFPITIIDQTTGGTGTIVGTACQQVGTPEWSRSRDADVAVYTFSSPKLIFSRGVRLTE